MPLILNIDTATEIATVSISKNDNPIYSLINNNQKEHASFLEPAIKQMLQQCGISIHKLNAVSVTNGPGSYTGLRVGMASAKGLCYAQKVPLITISTLEVLALSVIENTAQPQLYLYCPMIDARRMEVFTAIYDSELKEVMPPQAVILEPSSFNDLIKTKPIIFSGSGSKNFLNMADHLLSNDSLVSDSSLAKLSAKKYHLKQFAELSSTQPAYLKLFGH
jgi:tRNA threonylcarbamoyladenosine biosynthesis protein TsaB